MSKKFFFARCQEISKECPRKLADAIMNNDLAYLEPAKQPSEAGNKKRLYNDLWGRTGPTDPITLDNRAPELPLGDHFAPITVGEVEDKIKKIKKKSAAGPDDLLKENLLIPVLPIILAKFSTCYGIVPTFRPHGRRIGLH